MCVDTGSLASMAHSTIGNVAANSIFATLQSAGAGGAGLATVEAAVAAIASVQGIAIFSGVINKALVGEVMELEVAP